MIKNINLLFLFFNHISFGFAFFYKQNLLQNNDFRRLKRKYKRIRNRTK